MTPELLAKAIILGLVEGATEFIPVSSTGHLIVVSEWLGQVDDRAKTFDIFIQLGAILAIVWLYRGRLSRAAAAARHDPAMVFSSMLAWKVSNASPTRGCPTASQMAAASAAVLRKYVSNRLSGSIAIVTSHASSVSVSA